MRRCKYCGAKWRINYPYGKVSGGRITFIKRHDDNCKFVKRVKR